ncbi:CHAP domain-containing protein [Salmonella enterica]
MSVDALLNLAELLCENQIREDPATPNSGPEVDVFLASVGLKPGQPWCMAFVYWCHQQAGILDLPQTGSVHDFFEQARQDGRVFSDIKQLKPGDIVFNIEQGSHAGILSNIDNNDFYYISGNTSSTDPKLKKEGTSFVAKHMMNQDSYNYFARYWHEDE